MINFTDIAAPSQDALNCHTYHDQDKPSSRQNNFFLVLEYRICGISAGLVGSLSGRKRFRSTSVHFQGDRLQSPFTKFASLRALCLGIPCGFVALCAWGFSEGQAVLLTHIGTTSIELSWIAGMRC
jgi:hypothetical protein